MEVVLGEVKRELQQLTNVNTNILASLQRLQTARERSEVEVWCEARARVRLENLPEQDLGEDRIFMIESSPKEVLSSREGCALESAARNSGLGVVMVRVGQLLDLRDNTTCQLYTRSQYSRLVHSPLS